MAAIIPAAAMAGIVLGRNSGLADSLQGIYRQKRKDHIEFLKRDILFWYQQKQREAKNKELYEKYDIQPPSIDCDKMIKRSVDDLIHYIKEIQGEENKRKREQKNRIRNEKLMKKAYPIVIGGIIFSVIAYALYLFGGTN